MTKRKEFIMKVMINSVHFKADQKLEDFITQKVEKLCSKYNEVINAEVSLKLDNTDTPENKIADIKANCDLAIEGRDVKIMELDRRHPPGVAWRRPVCQQAEQDFRRVHRHFDRRTEETT